jgi:hypothetical protein
MKKRKQNEKVIRLSELLKKEKAETYKELRVEDCSSFHD